MSPTSILAALPRVSRKDAEATRAWLAWLGALPARVEAAVAGLGSVAIAVVGPAPSGGRALDGPAFGLVRGSGAGRLSIDGALARRLVAAALGVEGDGALAVRRLGLAERGLVAGLVASFLHSFRVALSVSVVAPDHDDHEALRWTAIDLALDVAGATGFARVEVPVGWLADAVSADLVRARLAGLTVEASVERARTFLSAGALASLEPGDAVVFDGERAALDADASGWPARVVIGDQAAAVEIEGDGRVCVRGDFQRVGAGVSSARSEEAAVETRSQGQQEATAVLAAAPVGVIAEVGRLVLRGDEVLGLTAGAVLTLGGARSSLVALRVGGEVWAEGELVDVDGELGVRVTKAFRRATL
jgi:flagellar motor switch/type III secretory pathway protein FliN